MKIAIAADHAGFDAKAHVLEHLLGRGLEVLDEGTHGTESVDYPDFAKAVATAVNEGRVQRGILICGTGIGMSIVANKFEGVRAALCHDEFTIEMSRAHNDANILCMGSRVIDAETMCRLTDVWIERPFEGGRHQRRVDKMTMGSR